MEVVLFNLLGLEYKLEYKNTFLHPKYGEFWSGTPDLVAEDKIGEIKCFEPLHFGKLSKLLIKGDIDEIKKEEKEVYWQCVSNAIICDKPKAEIIAYMPYKSELEAIIAQIEETNFLERHGMNDFDYYFMTHEPIETLPYLPDDSKFSNINKLVFEVPEEDKEFLTERMIEASKLLEE